ncbi:helix-turn-helix domain-containing protein [Ancylobacter sp. TS-1]|uniref:helix-turn-helix domain-containing protein n=1 Tax=Ancylobacter sp. TS-1 TaxID=1850374 RepID=UPI001265B560|nr:helix-turn-helix domain-containing protein [Ancylobacter sp. TS-1]QFR31687.1 chromosomal replication initiator DnaA [Ancylobacter sp. TS-1]
MPTIRTPAAHPAGRQACLVAARLAATATGLPLDRVLHPRRLDRRSASARALAMYLAHVGLGLPMTRVAADFGRHRSTVAHACRRIEERREVAGWDRRVAALEETARAETAQAEAGRAMGGGHG